MSSPTAADRRWLDAAARQAAPFLGTTGEHPAVGAIVIEPAIERLLGRAITAAGGAPRATTAALDDAGRLARGATLYLTLGVSAADAERILLAGPARVVIGTPDPAGEGAAVLREAGVEIVAAEHAGSKRLHEGYLSRTTKGRPHVGAVLAVSADGKVGLAGKGSFSILGETARRWIEMQRATTDAILIGWGTARAEPSLGVNLRGLVDRRPLRVVVAGLRTHEVPELLRQAAEQPIIVIATPEKKMEPPPGVALLRVKGVRSRPGVDEALKALAARGISTVLAETGPTLLESLLAAGLVDRFHLIRSEAEIGPGGMLAAGRGGIEARIGAAGFSLVDHRLLGADNLRTFERMF